MVTSEGVPEGGSEHPGFAAEAQVPGEEAAWGLLVAGGHGERTVFVVDQPGAPAAAAELGDDSGLEQARRVAEWLADPMPNSAGEIAWLAREWGLWDQLCEIWLAGLDDDGVAAALSSCGAFVELSDDIRRDFPLLTWAQAASHTVGLPAKSRHSGMMREILKDAMTLHCQWQSYAETDAAVLAGTIWLISQKYLPAVRGVDRLREAAFAYQAIQERIAESTRMGRPPSVIVRVVFCVFSAQFLLSAARLPEAHDQLAIARLLGGLGYDLSWYVHGMEQLIRTFMGRPESGTRGPTRARREVDIVGLGCFRLAGEGMALSSEAFLALRRLDRRAVTTALAQLTPMMRGDAVTGSLSGAVEALADAAWSDPELGLERLDAVAAAAMISGRGAGEPFSAATLASARARILAMMGATELAYELAGALPDALQPTTRAAALIWRGEFEEAAHVVEQALLTGGPIDGFRRQLVLIRLSALVAAAGDSGDPELSNKCLVAALACGEHGELLQFGLLPPGVRAALLDTAQLAAGDGSLVALARVRAALSELPVTGRPDRSMIKLTRREEVLLPLLASPDSVPDIARRLHVSPNTLRKQVVTLREKFDAPNRARLVRAAREMGFLSDAS